MNAPRLRKPDKLFFFLVVLLTCFGFFIFSSASLGLLGRDGPSFKDVALKQLVILLGSFVICLIFSKIDYNVWRRYSLWIFIGTVIFSLLVFVPGLGKLVNGANRWIVLPGTRIQPSEFLKLGLVFFLAAWFSQKRVNPHSFSQALIPLGVVLAIVSALMIAQPDIDTLVIMCTAAMGIFFAAGARWRHIFAISITVLVLVSVLAFTKPYIMRRVQAFFDPDAHTLGSSYQVNQSLIALGSGGLFGRGFGQSLQKFKYLPEPTSDSIFSVAGEEFGFLGTTIILGLFTAFGLAGFRIAARAANPFGRLLVVGIVIMISAGAAINIAAMLGLVPLTGTPLLFISQGGTALLTVLISAGIILSVSRHSTKNT